MHRSPSSPVIPLVYTAVSGAGIALAVAGGTNAASLVVGLVVAALGATLAVVAWRRTAPVGEAVRARHWWKFLLAGPVVIGGVVTAAGLGVEAWFVGMFLVVLALILTGVGLLLGLVRLAAPRPPTSPT